MVSNLEGPDELGSFVNRMAGLLMKEWMKCRDVNWDEILIRSTIQSISYYNSFYLVSLNFSRDEIVLVEVSHLSQMD